MAAEKYIVATRENSFHIAVRNILNPSGYMFMGNSNDPLALIRLIRSCSPDFVVIDLGIQWRELKNTLDTVDDEMLCACILVGDYKDMEIANILENSSVLSFCSKPVSSDKILSVVEMANINFKRVEQLNRQLKEVKDNYESKKLIERAKYLLMERDNISENEAYTRMRKKSMDLRISMKALAEDIILIHKLNGKK